jgi:hypothetical protein
MITVPDQVFMGHPDKPGDDDLMARQAAELPSLSAENLSRPFSYLSNRN